MGFVDIVGNFFDLRNRTIWHYVRARCWKTTKHPGYCRRDSQILHGRDGGRFCRLYHFARSAAEPVGPGELCLDQRHLQSGWDNVQIGSGRDMRKSRTYMCVHRLIAFCAVTVHCAHQTLAEHSQNLRHLRLGLEVLLLLLPWLKPSRWPVRLVAAARSKAGGRTGRSTFVNDPIRTRGFGHTVAAAWISRTVGAFNAGAINAAIGGWDNFVQKLKVVETAGATAS